MKMRALHSPLDVEPKGLAFAMQTRCGFTIYGYNEEHWRKMKKERTTEDPGKVTCKNCLRCVAAMQRKDQPARR
jgi:hypothetical protein